MSHFASMMQDLIDAIKTIRDALAMLHERVVALEAEVKALKQGEDK